MGDFTTKIAPESGLIRFNDECTIKVTRSHSGDLTFTIEYLNEKTGDSQEEVVAFLSGEVG